MHDNTPIQLPSGVTVKMEDPTGRLQRCFQDLFGNTATGLAVVVNASKKKSNDRRNT